NQTVLLQVQQRLDYRLLEQAVRRLLIHHDALRLRFTREESGWQQINGGRDEVVPLTLVDLSHMNPTEMQEEIESVAAELQASLNLHDGPITRVALFDCGPLVSQRLLLVIHHLVVDGISWRILLEDLSTVYQQLSSGQMVSLPTKTTSFKQWANQLVTHAQSSALLQEIAYWQAIASIPSNPLPVDFASGGNTVASAHTISLALTVQETQALLQQVPAAYHTQITDVLLTALIQAFADWTGEQTLLVNLEGHGR